MSLAEQTARVAGGGKNALKKILQKLGVTVGDAPIDQYAALAAQISDKLLPDNLLDDEVAGLYELPSSAVIKDVLKKIYSLFSSVDSQLKSKVEIVTGSYVGTGSAGESNPTSLTFDSKVIFLSILHFKDDIETYRNNYDEAYYVMPLALSTSYRPYVGLNGYTDTKITYTKKDESGKTISWYSREQSGDSGPSTAQYNRLGYEYFYMAIVEAE